MLSRRSFMRYLAGTGVICAQARVEGAMRLLYGTGKVAEPDADPQITKYGAIDKTGRFVIPPVFAHALRFTNGLARFRDHGKYGFIDRTGAIVIPPRFELAWSFSNGLAAVTVDGRWGYIDQTGSIAIEPCFDLTYAFSDGLASVLIGNRVGFIDRTGRTVCMLEYEFPDDARPVFFFCDGLADMEVAGKFGYIDKSAQLAISPRFEAARSFREGRVAVSKDGLWGFIDTQGEFVVKPGYDEVRSYRNGLAVTTNRKAGSVTRHQVLDPGGKLVFETGGSVDLLADFSDGLAAVEIGGAWGFVNTEGELVIHAQFDAVGTFSEGLAAVLVDNKWGFTDRDGNLAIKPQFCGYGHDIAFNKDLAVVSV